MIIKEKDNSPNYTDSIFTELTSEIIDGVNIIQQTLDT